MRKHSKNLFVSRLIVSLACLVVMSSCVTVTFDSTTIRDHSVKMNQAGEEQYEVLADFEVIGKAAWIIGIVPISKPAGDNHDYLADVIQTEIEKAGGDAVINLKLQVQNKPGDILISIVTFGIYVPRTATISGQVIKYK